MSDLPSFACATQTGFVREHNEDSYISMPEQRLWVVADGMGGHDCGEVASAIAVSEIAFRIRSGSDLKTALKAAHREILFAVNHGTGKRGMGSTVVALKLNGDYYQIAWVGDSRAYLWNGKSLEQLTHDHSVIQELLDSGEVTELEAIQHPYRNILTRSLGGFSSQPVEVDEINGIFRQGDHILLCSDGLTSEVPDSKISEILRNSDDLQPTVNQMVAAALNQGGSDNITVLLISA